MTFFCRISNVRKWNSLRAGLFVLFIGRQNFPRIETSEPVSMKGAADNLYSPTLFPGLFPSPGNEIAYCGEKLTIISIRRLIRKIKLRFGIFYCEKKSRRNCTKLWRKKITWCNNGDSTSEHNETVIGLAHCFCFYLE